MKYAELTYAETEIYELKNQRNKLLKALREIFHYQGHAHNNHCACTDTAEALKEIANKALMK